MSDTRPKHPASRASIRRAARGATPDAAVEAAAIDVLRRAGGALPVARLRATLEAEPRAREPLTRCLRGRGDLFLVVEPPAEPWREDEWTAAERAEYETRTPSGHEERVVLVDGSLAGAGSAAPVLLRETLLSMWGEAPDDDELKHALGRAVHGGRAGPAPLPRERATDRRTGPTTIRPPDPAPAG